MLHSLHVKNLALMEETEVLFGEGLNILTGETGAGKSLLIGGISLALGAKFEADMLRKGAENALVELIFTDNNEKVREKLAQMDLAFEEDTVIISRKLAPGKSICKINGETVTARQVKELAEVLLDLHGQHEHQSLLHKKKHLEILDSYCGEDFGHTLKEVEREYSVCKELKRKLEEESMDEESMAREKSLAEFELKEIEEARLIVGEDEELESRYRLMTNSKKITENLSESYRCTGSDFESSAGGNISRALRFLKNVSSYDRQLEVLEEQLTEIDNLLSDYNRDVSAYLSECEFDEEDFAVVEQRLNLINRLKEKYGSSIEAVVAYGQEKQQFLDKISDYDAYMEGLKKQLSESQERLETSCGRLSEIRKRNAVILEQKLKDALVHLNFLTVEFEIAVRPGQTITAKGYDEVEFLISTNPGEELKPLSQVASGGELSRVMLAIKTVLAGRDDIGTLIFDEIDAGISGRTAWRVSEQLQQVAEGHQVICITHLPQIAAMADRHFVIEKSSANNNTITDIRLLDEDESLKELARLLGSDSLSEAALFNAGEIRSQALQYKSERG